MSPDTATGTRTYTTKVGSYTLDLGANQVRQKDVDALDALAGTGLVTQENLYNLMQKYGDMVLINENGRELDSPFDLVCEELKSEEVSGMEEDFDGNATFAEAMRLVADAAQKMRQTQLEQAEAKRRESMVSAQAEYKNDIEAADATLKAAAVEGAVGIAAGGVGVIGGGVGLGKAANAQRLANKQANSTKKAQMIEKSIANDLKHLDAHKVDMADLPKAKADNKANIDRKDADIKKAEDEFGSLKAEQQNNKILGKTDTDHDKKVADKLTEIGKLKAVKAGLETRSTHLDDLGKKQDGLAGKQDELLKQQEKAKKYGVQSDVELNESRSLGALFTSLTQASNAAGKAAAAPLTYEAAVLTANGKMDGVNKDAATNLQGQHQDAGNHARELFSGALDAIRSVQEKKQDTLNHIADRMA